MSVLVEELGFRKVEERERSWGFIFPEFGVMPRHEGDMLWHEALLPFCPGVACLGMKESCCGM